MVKIRLARAGTKKRPFYRVVASDSRSPRDGRFIEQLGIYDPKRNPAVFEIKQERVDYWLGTGAQTTETLRRLILQRRKALAEAPKAG